MWILPQNDIKFHNSGTKHRVKMASTIFEVVLCQKIDEKNNSEIWPLFGPFFYKKPLRDRCQLTSTNRAFLGRVLYKITVFLGAYFHFMFSELKYHTKQREFSFIDSYLHAKLQRNPLNGFRDKM